MIALVFICFVSLIISGRKCNAVFSVSSQAIGYRITGSSIESVNTLYFCGEYQDGYQCLSLDGSISLRKTFVKTEEVEQTRWFLREADGSEYLYGAIELSLDPIWEMKQWKRVIGPKEGHEYEPRMKMERIMSDCEAFRPISANVESHASTNNVVSVSDRHRVMPLSDHLWFFMNVTVSSKEHFETNYQVIATCAQLALHHIKHQPFTPIAANQLVEGTLNANAATGEEVDTARVLNEYSLLRLAYCDYLSLTQQTKRATLCFEKALMNYDRTSRNNNNSSSVESSSLENPEAQTLLSTLQFYQFFAQPTVTALNKKDIKHLVIPDVLLLRSPTECNLATLNLPDIRGVVGSAGKGGLEKRRFFCHYFGGLFRFALHALAQEVNPLHTIQVVNTALDTIHTVTSYKEIFSISHSTEYRNLRGLEMVAHCLLGRCHNYIVSYNLQVRSMLLKHTESYAVRATTAKSTREKELSRQGGRNPPYDAYRDIVNMHLNASEVVDANRVVLRYIKQNTQFGDFLSAQNNVSLSTVAGAKVAKMASKSNSKRLFDSSQLHSLFSAVYKLFRDLKIRSDDAVRSNNHMLLLMVQRDDVLGAWQGLVSRLLSMGQIETAALHTRDMIEHLCDSTYDIMKAGYYTYKYYNPLELQSAFNRSSSADHNLPLAIQATDHQLSVNYSNSIVDARKLFNLHKTFGLLVKHHPYLSKYVATTNSSDVSVKSISSGDVVVLQSSNVRAALVLYDLFYLMLRKDNAHYMHELFTDAENFALFLKVLLETCNPKVLELTPKPQRGSAAETCGERNGENDHSEHCHRLQTPQVQEIVVLNVLQYDVMTHLVTICKEYSAQAALTQTHTPNHCQLLQALNSIGQSVYFIPTDHATNVSHTIETGAVGVDSLGDVNQLYSILHSEANIADLYTELVVLGNEKLPWNYTRKATTTASTTATVNSVGAQEVSVDVEGGTSTATAAATEASVPGAAALKTTASLIKVGVFTSITNITENERQQVLSLLTKYSGSGIYDLYLITPNHTAPVTTTAKHREAASLQNKQLNDAIASFVSDLPVLENKVISLPIDLKSVARRLRLRSFDLMLFSQLHSDPFLYHSALFRVAPLQAIIDHKVNCESRQGELKCSRGERFVFPGVEQGNPSNEHLFAGFRQSVDYIVSRNHLIKSDRFKSSNPVAIATLAKLI